MKKDLQKKGEGLMIYFTKKECQFENYKAGDIVDLSDIIVKRGKKTFKGIVTSCCDSEFHDIECLESDTQFGFFKDINDSRPSQCTWVDKEVAVKLYKLFNGKGWHEGFSEEKDGS